MDDKLTDHTASLFRVDADGSVHRVLPDIGISNCFVWSLKNDVFYFADSLDKKVYRFDYDHKAGAISNRTVFVDMSDGKATPDGGTIDAEGFIWITHWDGWRLVRYAPDGRVDRTVDLPFQKPTSCMFGGPDLRTLYVTSAIWDLTPDKLQSQPNAGGLFALDVGVAGVPETRFAG
jgi:sugar lactone lactonase YvrE